jgi:membrane associated rhomboid family serine protease
MEHPTAIIPVRSERQAMDWSLVLASQGIEILIAQSPEDGAWHLVVPAAEHTRAQAALGQYLLENRQRAWRQELSWTGLLFDWRAVFWCLLMGVIFTFQNAAQPDLTAAGMMDGRAVLGGEWWRLVTAVSLHHDLPHLISNVTTGLILLGLAMGSYGAGTALLAAWLAGVGGNMTGLLLYGATYRSLGASGLVMGALGLLTVLSLAFRREDVGARQWIGRGVLAGFFLLILLGMSPRSDVVAHVGGFGAGGLLGLGWRGLPERWRKHPLTDHGAALVCGVLVALSWWLALRTRG